MLIDVDHLLEGGRRNLRHHQRQPLYYRIYAGHRDPMSCFTDYMKYPTRRSSTPRPGSDYIKRSGGMVALRTRPEGMGPTAKAA